MKDNEQQVNRQPPESREPNPPAEFVNNDQPETNDDHSRSSETRRKSTVSPIKIEANRQNSQGVFRTKNGSWEEKSFNECRQTWFFL